MAIVSLIHPQQVTSGGHRYNVQLEDTLERKTGAEVLRIMQPYDRYTGIRKALAPLLELGCLRRVAKEDTLILGDTTYRYHYLLLWVRRLMGAGENWVIIHHFAYLGLTGWRRKVSEWLQDRYYRRADRIIVPSPYTKALAEKKFGSEKVCYVPLPFRSEFETSQHYRVGQLLFVGTIEARKGIHFMPEILEQVRRQTGENVEITLVGKVIEEDYWKNIEADFAQRGLTAHIHRMGHVSTEVLHQLYQEAEVFLFPSLLEGYGIVLVEAMSHGLPIVAFDNSAMPYSIHHDKNGLLAKNADAESMSRELARIIGNRELRTRLQEGMAQTMREIKTENDFEEAVKHLIK